MLTFLLACTGADCEDCFTCGPGTHEEDGVCVPDEEADADTDADTDADADADADSDTDSDADTDPGEGCDLLAFRREGNIWTMNPDGSGVTQVTDGEADDGYPAIHPDCGSVAFVRGGGGILEAALDGSGETLVYAGEGETWRTPRWSPDGAMLSASSDLDGTNAIFVMEANGANLARLTDATVSSGDADWHPDGELLVFSAFGDIATIHADGTAETLLTTDEAWDAGPKWSPDGTQIVFQSTRGGGSHLYVMDADGSNITALTTEGEQERPDWSPDGLQIAYRSWTDNAEIEKANADGSGAVNLTNTPDNEFEVDWR